MPKCKRCGSSDVVEHKGELRCSVCDTVIPVRQDPREVVDETTDHEVNLHTAQTRPENFTYDKASGGFVVDNPTKTGQQPRPRTWAQQIRGLTHESSRPINAPKWEYNVLWTENAGLFGWGGLAVISQGDLKDEDIEVALDVLGEDGWELVTNGTKSSLFGPMRKKTYFVFKREC